MRLPHEQDESALHKAQPPARVMKNALADLQSGRADTDTRGSDARAVFDGQHAKSTQTAPVEEGRRPAGATSRTRRRRGDAT